jgi:general secretion pathway protein G
MEMQSGSRRRRGFSLLEMVIVLGIIALILGAAIKYATGINDAAKYTATKAKINEAISKLGAYRLVAGGVPTEEQGLMALVERPMSAPVPKRWVQQYRSVPKDSWGNDLIYLYPSKVGSTRMAVISMGTDGKIGGGDDVSSLDED